MYDQYSSQRLLCPREALRRAALQCLGRQEERDREYESKLRSIILKRKLKAHQKEELEFKEAYDLLVEKRRNYFPDPSFDLDGDGIVGIVSCSLL